MGNNIRLYFFLAVVFGLLAIAIFIYPGVSSTWLGVSLKVLTILSFAVYLWVLLQELQINMMTNTQQFQAEDIPEQEISQQETNKTGKQEMEKSGGLVAEQDSENKLADSDATKAYHAFQQHILEIIQQTFFCHAAMVYIADVRNNKIVLQDQVGTNGILRDQIEMGSGLLSSALTQDTVIVKKELTSGQDDDSVNYYQDEAPDIQSFLAVPVHYKGSGIGVLALDQTARDSFSEEDGLLLQKYADLISAAMVQFDFLEMLNEQRDMYARLSRLNAQLSVTENVDEIFRLSVSICRDLFVYDSLLVVLLQSQESEQAEVATVDGNSRGIESGYRFELQESLLHEVIKKGAPQHHPYLDMNDVRFEKVHELQTEDPSELNSLLIVPIKSHMEIYGAFVLESSVPGQFKEESLEILQNICSMFGAGLNRFYLYRYMENIASKDGLTNLHNYRAFRERLEDEIQRSNRYETPFILCIADLDKFKRINDTYGHLFGDYVLQETAHIIQSNVRRIDMVARYGGEEFALILVNAVAEDILNHAENIRQQIKDHLFEKDGIKEHITISIGIAEYPTHADNLDTLISSADEAMYEVKKQGGDAAHIYNGSTYEEEV